jgi:hypothetical protein
MSRDPSVGLCGDCSHAERVVSARGSVFYLCQRSFTDPAFPKYPPIPVVACGGYERDTGTGRQAMQEKT